MAGNIAEVAKSNEYSKETVGNIDKKSENDLHDFAEYYKNASDEEKKSLDEKYNQYFNEELQKDSELKNKLNDSEKTESAEISPEDINNLNTVRKLTDVLNTYPAVSNPEYRAVRRMVDEYMQNLSKETEKVLSNKEKTDGDKDKHD